MATFVRMSTSVALLASLAGCASATSVVKTPPIVETEKTIRIEPRDGGWKFDELADYLHRVAGVSILYESQNRTVKENRLFVGPCTLAEDELFPWMQAWASDRNMTLVPIWHGADGRRQWFVVEETNGAVFIDSVDVPSYADRASLRVATWFRVAVSMNSSRRDRLVADFANLNYVLDLPGSPCLLVSGPAPAVAAAQREVERFNAETRPADAPSAPPIDRSEP
jgi:hypothetical protein